MASTDASAPAGTSEKGGGEIAMWRLYVLRAAALFLAISGIFTTPPMLMNASPTDRGMIKAFLTGLWIMSFFAVRYPVKMMPLFLFEFAWKAAWLMAFGIPQWMSGVGSPRLSQDLLEIGLPPILLALVIPWTYVWRHYFREASEPWR